MLLCCWVVCSFCHSGGGIVAGPGGMGGCSCLAIGRCGAAPCTLSVFLRLSMVRGPYGIIAERGPGPPGAGRVGSECPNQGGVLAWCPGVLAYRLVGPGAPGALPGGLLRAATSVGSAGWCAASRARCLRCGVRRWGVAVCGWGVSSPLWGGRGLGSGVVWARGRSPAGSGCRGLTFGGSFLVSLWCVPWRTLVSWLWKVPVACSIHGGTTVCRGVAMECAAGCRGVACVGVAHGVCNGAFCVVLGGSSWRSVVVVRRGRSWVWRLLGGCRTC